MTISEAKILIDYIILSGKRLFEKSGKIKESDLKKEYVTEEDIKIERDIKEIITNISGDASFYAEEENDVFKYNKDIWVCDPISGTKLFIQGLPHYAIVASHLTNGVVDFAVVYNPSCGNLYTADKLSGAFLNEAPLTFKNHHTNKVIFAPSTYIPVKSRILDFIPSELNKEFEVFPSQGSFAINYCLVASGNFDGVISITKDSYPEFAGCFIANMSGYIATNIDKMVNILPTDRYFTCGNKENFEKLYGILKKSL